jgi:hypothetical protein
VDLWFFYLPSNSDLLLASAEMTSQSLHWGISTDVSRTTLGLWAEQLLERFIWQKGNHMLALTTNMKTWL